MARLVIVGPPGRPPQSPQWEFEDCRQRLEELGVVDLVRRFQATNPPSNKLEKLDAILLRLLEAIRANGDGGHPPSRWELNALQKLRRYAEKGAPPQDAASASPAPPVEHASAPVAPPQKIGEGDTSLEAMIVAAYETGGAKNKSEAYDIVRERAKTAGFHVSEDQFEAVRKKLDMKGNPGRRRRNPPCTLHDV
jgi:hypothetical protein